MNLTLKSVPESLHAKLLQRAERNRRSLNKETISILEEALNPKTVSPKRFIAEVKKLQKKTNFSLTLSEIQEAIESGRQ